MGLDLVELVIRTEETFAIEIPNEDAEQIQTVGDLYRFTLARLNLPYEPAVYTNSPPNPRITPWGEQWTPQEVWRTLHYVVTDQLQVDPDDVYESASFQMDLGAD